MSELEIDGEDGVELDAMARSINLPAKLGIHAVAVDVIDQKTKEFSEKYPFSLLGDSEPHLSLEVAREPRGRIVLAIKLGGV